MDRSTVLLCAFAVCASACSEDNTRQTDLRTGGADFVDSRDDAVPTLEDRAGATQARDTLHVITQRLERKLAPLTTWREAAEAALRPDSGTVRADTTLLQLRSSFQEQVRRIAGTFNDSAFQALIWPDGAWSRQLRRAHQRTSGPDSLDTAMADSVISFLARSGIQSARAEGDTYFVAREAALLEWFGRFVTEPTREFLSLWAMEQRAPTAADGGIQISPDELAGRLAATDRFLVGYPDAVAHDLAMSRFRWYLSLYLAGLPNTPAFDWRSGVLVPELHQSYERYISDHAATPSGKLVSEYLALLEVNGFRRQGPVEQFLIALQVAAGHHD
jgi:hypothetical protein